MKYLLLNFKGLPTYSWVEYSTDSGLIRSESENFSNLAEINHLMDQETCIVVDELAIDEPTLSI